jgi:uncharacterized protein with LGFP repeats
MARIVIEDLPPVEQLSVEEMQALFGAGRKPFQPSLESLESRELMAANLTASLLPGGVLHIEGTERADQIRVVQTGSELKVEGFSIQTASGLKSSVSLASVRLVEVDALGGDDQFWATYTPPGVLPQIRFDGGAGNDTLTGPTGTVLDAEAGKDTLRGAVLANGRLLELGTDGRLLAKAASGGPWGVVAANVRDFAVGTDGALYTLGTDNNVSRFATATPGQSTLFESAVARFAVSGDKVILLGTDGYLRQRNSDRSGLAFADDVNGTSVAGGYEANVVSFGVDAGYVHLRTARGVFKVVPLGGGPATIYRGLDPKQGAVKSYEVSGTWAFMGFADGYVRQQKLDGTGWDFAFLRAGASATTPAWGRLGDRLYGLAGDGTLLLRTVDQSPAQTAPVAGVQAAGNGLFFLDGDALYRFDRTTGALRRFDANPVKSFDTTSDGYVFFLATGGTLYKKPADATAAGSAVRFNSSLVDSFSIRADVVYMLERATGTDPGYLVQQGSNDATAASIRLRFQETSGLLFFRPGNDSTYLFSLNRASGRVLLWNKITSEYTVSGAYLVNLKTDGTLAVNNVSTGQETTNEAGVRSYLVAGTRVLWLATDGYLRQRELVGGKATFADDENGAAVSGGYEKGVVEYGVTGNYLHLRTAAGVVKVVPVGGGLHTVHRTDVTSYAVAGKTVVMLFADQKLRQQNLDGTGWDYVHNTRTVLRHVASGGNITTLWSDGYLESRRLSDGLVTFHRDTVRGFAVASGKVFMEFADGYVRQQNLDGTGWQYTFLRNGARMATSAWGIAGERLYGLANDGLMFSRTAGQNPEQSAALAAVREAGGKYFFRDYDGYLLALDPVAHLVTTYDSTKVQAFGTLGDQVYMFEVNGYLIKQGANSTSYRRIAFENAGSKLFFHDPDGSFYYLDTMSNGVGNVVSSYRIRQKYDALYAAGADLGLPQGDAYDVTGGSAQAFDRGVIYYLGSATRTYAVYHEFYDAWKTYGGAGVLGRPRGDEEKPGSNGLRAGQYRQQFDRGVVWWTRGAGAVAAHTDLYDAWKSHGGEAALGRAVRDEERYGPLSHGLYKQEFAYGTVFWSRDGQTSVVLKQFLEVAQGAGLGAATTDTFKTADGGFGQHFTRGGVYRTAGGETIVIGNNALWQRYLGMRAESGTLGLPTSNGIDFGGGWSGHQFAHGALVVRGGETRLLASPLWEKYFALGGANGSLGGLVTGDEVTTLSGARYTLFQRGALYWQPGSDPTVVVDTSGLVNLTRVTDEFLASLQAYADRLAPAARQVVLQSLRGASGFSFTTGIPFVDKALGVAANEEGYKRLQGSCASTLAAISGLGSALADLTGFATAFIERCGQAAVLGKDGQLDRACLKMFEAEAIVVRDLVGSASQSTASVTLDVLTAVTIDTFASRALNAHEVELANSIFGKLDTTGVRVCVISNSVPLDRPFVHGRVIYVTDDYTDGTTQADRMTLAHELTHVLQDQHSTDTNTYSAIRDQFHNLARGDQPYKVELTDSTNWSDLSAEQQAAVVEAYQGHLDGTALPLPELSLHWRVLSQAGLFQWRPNAG